MNFWAHFQLWTSYAVKMRYTMVLWRGSLVFLKDLCTTSLKESHDYFYFSFIVFENKVSHNSFHMSRSVKLYFFNLALNFFGNMEHKYAKQSPSFGSDFTNCFISSNLIRWGGNKIFSGWTRVVLIKFFLLGED